ncbi:DUF2182 domain-containing protein [Methylobacterium sp. SyP6R]|uniref:DUF2182 domain-containing protein n=1 Tax=Methylobacterium sp. SyP6R TaxID=2718876 RepID=UPI001F1C1162|nr:DUF2182 domain-containing protein [Methylobacterium sp. SyP6R]MCF4127360.1 DUF2182 domain-containing protein [Methylobacterium sp. SyP6R]
MTPAARERWGIRGPVLAVSAAAWALLAAAPPGWTLPESCAAAWRPPSSDDVILALSLNPPGSLAAAWILMLAAMMGPILVAPLGHLRGRSLASRRGRSLALFLAGYAAAWSVAGIGLAALALTLRLSAPSVAPVPALLAILVWQASPAKQTCLNRCHDRPALSAFGVAADRDAARFGLVHGVWCVGSCWPLMLAMLLPSDGHLVAMIALAGWLLAERVAPAVPPGWRWHPWRGGPVLRIAAGFAAAAWSRLATRVASPPSLVAAPIPPPGNAP